MFISNYIFYHESEGQRFIFYTNGSKVAIDNRKMYCDKEKKNKLKLLDYTLQYYVFLNNFSTRREAQIFNINT